MRRKVKELMRQLKVLTPDALVRWDIIISMLKLSIEGLKEGITYKRVQDLFDWHIARGNVYATVDLLLKKSVIEPLERKHPHDRFKFTNTSLLWNEIQIWHDIQKLRPISELLRFGIEKLTELLNELNRFSKSERLSDGKEYMP